MKSLAILLAGIGIWSLGLVWPALLSQLFSWPALVVLLVGWSLSHQVGFGWGDRRSTNGQDGSAPQQPSTPVPVVQTQ